MKLEIHGKKEVLNTRIQIPGEVGKVAPAPVVTRAVDIAEPFRFHLRPPQFASSGNSGQTATT